MKSKTTLALLAAVAVAGIVAYSLSRKPTSEELAEQRRRVLPDFDPEQVDSLAIRDGDRQIVCERNEGGEWRIVEPIRARADRWAVEGILDRLEMAERVSSVRPERGRTLELEPYGLDEPLRTVVMRSGAPRQREWVVTFGKEAGVADALFARVEGRPGVLAVPRDVAEKANVTVNELRSKQIAPRISTLELERVKVPAAQLGGEPGFEVECVRSQGTWEVKRPFHDLADRDAVEGLADKLYAHRLGADDFVADDAGKAPHYGLDDPLLTLTLEGDERTQEVSFGRAGEGDEAEWFAMLEGEPTIVRVPESLVEELRREPGELRERSLADFWPDDVAEIVIERLAGKLRLTKQDEDWRIEGDEPADADEQIVGDLLASLREAEIEKFVTNEVADPAPYGLDEGRRIALALYDEDGEELARVRLGEPKADEGAVYGMRPPYPPVFTLERADYVQTALGGRLALLDRLVLDEAAGDATLVEVDAERDFTCVWNADESRWELAEPVEGPADHWAVQTLVGELSRLRAERFAAEGADEPAAYGLDEPTVTVRVTFGRGAEAEPRVRTLRVGARADGGRYAQVEGVPRVFILSERVVADLTAEPGSKQIARATELTGLAFRRGERTARFAYDRDALKWTDPEGGELPEALSERLVEAARLLRDFRAAAVADYVEGSPARYGFDEPYLAVVMDEETVRGKTVLIGDEAEGGRYARGPVTGYVHVAGAEDVAALEAPLAEPEAPPAPEAGAK